MYPTEKDIEALAIDNGYVAPSCVNDPNYNTDAMNDIWDAAEAQLVKESYEEIKAAIQHPWLNLDDETLTKIANKLNEFYLSSEDMDCGPVYWDLDLPCFYYKGFDITIKNANWYVTKGEASFYDTDLLSALQVIDQAA